MPINDFEGDTFVAFLDISGFKDLMKKKIAWKALDRLYQYGYEIIRENSGQVEGLFVSDSGILFVRNRQDKVRCLKALLKVVKELNKRMIKDGFMLTTSIAYGHFKYQKRIEFKGMEKNPIYGNAYVSAFLDNENGTPKIQPGQCRIVKKNLPDDVIHSIKNGSDKLLRMIKEKGNHFYFYWMREDPSEINDFEKQYSAAYDLKYVSMLRALKGERNEYRFG
ncbi:MAG: hypothetical protein Q6352_002265 [Candidatus Freyrarchaeum guaymaensis]